MSKIKCKNLSESINIISSNLSLIRFISAIFVIFCHAYPLSANEVDVLSRISGGTLSFGNLAVAVFLISSGLLVSKSIEKKGEAKTYFKARCIKIFPPLILTVIATIIIMGIFFSNYEFLIYLKMSGTYKYLLNCILVPIHSLPGIFLNNIYGSTVNGSLWTLPIEFICYIGLFIAFKISLTKREYFKYTFIPVILLYIFINIIDFSIIIALKGYLQPIFMFYMGMYYYIYRDKIYFNLKYFIFCIFGFCITIVLRNAWIGLFMFFPYIIVYLSFGIRQISNYANKLGNISYGIYLCAFPIQQAIVHCFGGSMNPIVNVILAVPLSILMGLVIYYFGEKKIGELL